MAADMALHAACARRRQGEVLGGEAGRGLVARADAWMTEQKIRNPERMAAMLAPAATNLLEKGTMLLSTPKR